MVVLDFLNSLSLNVQVLFLMYQSLKLCSIMITHRYLHSSFVQTILLFIGDTISICIIMLLIVSFCT